MTNKMTFMALLTLAVALMAYPGCGPVLPMADDDDSACDEEPADDDTTDSDDDDSTGDDDDTTGDDDTADDDTSDDDDTTGDDDDTTEPPPEDLDGDGYTVNDGDCDDNDPAINPGAAEVCDGVDQDCDLLVDEGLVEHIYYPDVDGDGYGDEFATPTSSCFEELADHVTNAADCDDADAGISPAAAEICGDGIDQNCDTIDPVCPPNDFDGDGYDETVDCDDANAAINPGAPEICDGIDNDCDSTTDVGAIDATEYFLDYDGDGYGLTGYSEMLCAPDGAYTALVDGDCNDTSSAINPGAVEACDGLDTDCSGSPDADEVDADGDGFMVCDGDCNDADATVNPDALEICDGADNDCSGSADDGLDFLDYFEDADGDGYGDESALPVSSCEPLTGYSLSDTDCDDADPNVNPGMFEVENGIDDDCDGDVDEGFEEVYVEVCHDIGTEYNLVWMLLDTGYNDYSVPVASLGSSSGLCYLVEEDLFNGYLLMNYGYTSGNTVDYAAFNNWCTGDYRGTLTVDGVEMTLNTDFILVSWDEWGQNNPCGFGWDLELSYIPPS